jgi:hypothetical protein
VMLSCGGAKASSSDEVVSRRLNQYVVDSLNSFSKMMLHVTNDQLVVNFRLNGQYLPVFYTFINAVCAAQCMSSVLNFETVNVYDMQCCMAQWMERRVHGKLFCEFPPLSVSNGNLTRKRNKSLYTSVKVKACSVSMNEHLGTAAQLLNMRNAQLSMHVHERELMFTHLILALTNYGIRALHSPPCSPDMLDWAMNRVHQNLHSFGMVKNVAELHHDLVVENVICLILLLQARFPNQSLKTAYRSSDPSSAELLLVFMILNDDLLPDKHCYFSPVSGKYPRMHAWMVRLFFWAVFVRCNVCCHT